MNREKDGADLEGGRPVVYGFVSSNSTCRQDSGQGWLLYHTFQDVEADAAKLVDIGVEYLGEEADLGRCHGIIVGEEQLQLECAT